MQEPKFPECRTCRVFHRNAINEPIMCQNCSSGEFYEERVDESAPTDWELMRMFAQMQNDSDDDGGSIKDTFNINSEDFNSIWTGMPDEYED